MYDYFTDYPNKIMLIITRQENAKVTTIIPTGVHNILKGTSVIDQAYMAVRKKHNAPFKTVVGHGVSTVIATLLRAASCFDGQLRAWNCVIVL